MNKRWITLLMVLVLSLSFTMCGAEEIALSQKLENQLTEGSGLKSRVTLTAAGEGDWAWVNALNGVTLELSYLSPLRNENDPFQFQALLDIIQNEQVSGHVQVDGNADYALIKSDLLNENVIKVPMNGQDILNALTGDTKENDHWLSMITALQYYDDTEKKLETALAPYLTQLDFWIQSFAGETIMEKDVSDETLLKLECKIPGSEIKAQLKLFLTDLFADEAIMSLFAEIFTPTQIDTYLNASHQSYYFNMIDGLSLPGEIIYTTTFTMQGETISTHLHLPFASETSDSCFIDLYQHNEDMEIKLVNQDTYILVLTSNGSDAGIANVQRGAFAYIPATDGEPTAFAFQVVTQEKEWLEASDDKMHYNRLIVAELTSDVSSWQSIVDAMPQYEAFAPTTISYEEEYYSGQGKTKATTLALDITVKQGDNSLNIDGLFKSKAPWTLEEAVKGVVVDLKDLMQTNLAQ